MKRIFICDADMKNIAHGQEINLIPSPAKPTILREISLFNKNPLRGHLSLPIGQVKNFCTVLSVRSIHVHPEKNLIIHCCPLFPQSLCFPLSCHVLSHTDHWNTSAQLSNNNVMQYNKCG